ncbi:MAG TPA: RES family NAD+ phosphorylase [Thermoanaerobaculia bacterium]|nr:RES family NAD+ phosphorylase [Thermoanaerobaculia bacterium]
MPRSWHPRDIELLDALDGHEGIQISAPAWRAVRTGRDPLVGHPSRGRWDPGTFDVIYTSLEREGALAELYFHLSRQPVFPTKTTFSLHQLRVRGENTLRFLDLRELEPLGVEESQYSSILYERTRSIGDAAHFLGFDGIVAPSARWNCLNMVLFTDQVNPAVVEVVESSLIDWDDWRRGSNLKS